MLYLYFFAVKGSNGDETSSNSSSQSASSSADKGDSASVIVPDLVGEDYDVAKEKLEILGLKVVTYKKFDPEYAVNKVISQSVEPNSEVEKGGKVTLTISKGSETLSLPNFVGKTYVEANKSLTDLGLKVKIIYTFDNKSKEDIVTKQDVAANSTVTKGDTISLTVSGGIANTIGNNNENCLYGGFVATQGNWIYYANIGGDGYLYKVNKDGSGRQKLANKTAKNINVVGLWVYFCDDKFMYKVRIDGTELTKIVNGNFTWIHVENSWIYYTNANTSNNIYRIKTSGTSNQLCLESANFVNLENNTLYYSTRIRIKDTPNFDYYVHSISTSGSNKQVVYDGHGYNLFANSKNLYILTSETVGKILKVDLKTGFKTNHTIQNNIYPTFVNATENEIFLVGTASGQSAIYKMDPDTFKLTKIHSFKGGNTSDAAINIVDGWIYFKNPDDNLKLYRIKTDGSKLEKFYF